jgi:ribonuclease-3
MESSGLEPAESPLDLAKRLELPFSDLRLITRALTHRSYVNEHDEALSDNERLEFLGDAVLDFVVGAWLFNHYPEKAEGELTRMRSALVRTEQLAEFARQLNLGAAMRLGRGEIQAGGREKDILLCGTFEAMVGALYLQTNITAVQEFIHGLLDQTSDKYIFQTDSFDPKSTLQEWSQAQKLGIPNYVTVNTSGPDHDRLFVVNVQIGGKVYGSGTGHSKQIASRLAALDAINSINNHEGLN